MRVLSRSRLFGWAGVNPTALEEGHGGSPRHDGIVQMSRKGASRVRHLMYVPRFYMAGGLVTVWQLVAKARCNESDDEDTVFQDLNAEELELRGTPDMQE